MSTETESQEQWVIWHSLSSPNPTGKTPCETRCGDPVCEYAGCLNVSATKLRQFIMSGVKVLRRENDPAYAKPYTRSTTYAKSCDNGGRCIDSVCRVTGCLSVPGWRYRKEIKKSIAENLSAEEAKKLE